MIRRPVKDTSYPVPSDDAADLADSAPICDRPECGKPISPERWRRSGGRAKTCSAYCTNKKARDRNPRISKASRAQLTFALGPAVVRERINPLESPPLDPPRARSDNVDTSHIAAELMLAKTEDGESIAATQRRKILAVLFKSERDLNPSEIDSLLGWPAATTGRRLADLRRAGLIERQEKTISTHGRPSYSHRITPSRRADVAQILRVNPC